jgi:hypothetical protein
VSECDGRLTAACDLPVGHLGLCHFPYMESAKKYKADFHAMVDFAAAMERALRLLQEWDMLALGPDGRGISTPDAPWARLVIQNALTERTQPSDNER